jgi:hypothetical protein
VAYVAYFDEAGISSPKEEPFVVVAGVNASNQACFIVVADNHRARKLIRGTPSAPSRPAHIEAA